MMKKKLVVVGAGISGLTAAAYLSKEGHQVTLLEKSEDLGGLVGSFTRDGFVFDNGIRGVENSGTLFPMLKQLGIQIEFVKDIVDMGIEHKIVSIDPTDHYQQYKELLLESYPQEKDGIDAIFRDIKKISKYMEVLYDVDNPLFLNPKTDQKYLVKTIIPWMFKYTFTIGKIEKLKTPIRQYLGMYTKNQDLMDAICQHFFTDTPAFFALSYLKMHSDYYYPLGGTRSIVHALRDYIMEHGGIIKTDSEVNRIDVEQQVAYHKDQATPYDALLWCGDLNSLYRSIENTNVDYQSIQQKLENSKGNDSLYQMYLSVDLPKSYFEKIFSGHLFYMPNKEGLSSLKISTSELISKMDSRTKQEKEKILKEWLIDFSKCTTYEISIPVLHDETLAPKNQAAVIISTLFEYELTKYILDQGLYDVFKKHFSKTIINELEASIFPGWIAKILHYFEATPITIESRLNNTGGAITGWSFSNEIPVEHKLFKIAKSVHTPFPRIYQSSQWSFSPSGFPTSIVTAKIAANKIHKLKM